ncbi:hypothetical protein [Clostridium sp. E02]|uniref:hypothetical protein n=1 Tax=Clostridium sp. E02 TaxID=2487134 RepID=UPI000F542915|nr:hypothetical protein [Clostridium sp. E02]
MISKTKKIILFLAEGPTDEETLSPILKSIFSSQEVRFHIVHGDLTSNWSVTGKNVLKTVSKLIEEERKRYGFHKNDILKVVHLVDTDGAFIPKEFVSYKDIQEVSYTENQIETRAPKAVIERNERKSQILASLAQTEKISSIPYFIYYFSRNLEHVFHNSSKNLTIEEKVNFADSFADQYEYDTEGFLSFLSQKGLFVPGSYKETWEYISKEVNSLKRCSNFYLLFQSK